MCAAEFLTLTARIKYLREALGYNDKEVPLNLTIENSIYDATVLATND